MLLYRLRVAAQHLQHFGTRNTRAKKALAVYLAHVSDFITDRCDLAHGRLEPLLRVRRTAEPLASMLPGFVRKEECRELSEVEIIDDGQRL